MLGVQKLQENVPGVPAPAQEAGEVVGSWQSPAHRRPEQAGVGVDGVIAAQVLGGYPGDTAGDVELAVLPPQGGRWREPADGQERSVLGDEEADPKERRDGRFVEGGRRSQGEQAEDR